MVMLNSSIASIREPNGKGFTKISLSVYAQLLGQLEPLVLATNSHHQGYGYGSVLRREYLARYPRHSPLVILLKHKRLEISIKEGPIDKHSSNPSVSSPVLLTIWAPCPQSCDSVAMNQEKQ
jgi:hypothetical protein